MNTTLTTQQIEQMLERFINGTSTLAEEAQLTEYFSTHDVPAEWQAYKEMFAMFERGETELPPIESDSSPRAEIQPLPRPATQHIRWWRYAACLAIPLLIGAFLLLRSHDDEAQPSPMQAVVNEPKADAQPVAELPSTPAKADNIRTETPAQLMAAQQPPKPRRQSVQTATPPPPAPVEEVSDSPVEEEQPSPTPEEVLLAEYILQMEQEAMRIDPAAFQMDIRARGERLTRTIEEKMNNQTFKSIKSI